MRGLRYLSKRKMLAAEEEIANKVAEMAKERGATVFQTVNDILEEALRVDGMGLALREVIDRRGVLEKAREMGFTFTVERLLYDVVDTAYDHARKQLSELWLEEGRWYGNYFANKRDDGLKAFREAMELLTFGTSDFAVEESGDNIVSVACVGERFTPGFTDLFSLFIQGVFEALGYKQVAREVSKGIIRLKFERSR